MGGLSALVEGEVVARPGEPAAPHQALRDRAGRQRELDPQTETVRCGGGDAVIAQQFREGGVPLRVVRGGVGDLGHDGRVGQLGEGQALQQVADPGGAGAQTHTEAISGLRIRRRDREAHVRPEELRDRAHKGEATVLRADERFVGALREHREVIVLDDEHVRVLREHRPQFCCASGREARSRGVLRPWSADHGADARLQGRLQPINGHALGVDRHGDGAVSAQSHGVDAGEEARVLERDRVIAHERLSEQALDRIDGTAGHGDAEVDVGQIAGHPVPRPFVEPAIDHRFAIEHRAGGDRHEGRSGIRDEARIRVAGADVSEHGVRRVPLLRHGLQTGDHGSGAPAGDHEAGLCELPIRSDRRVAVHAECGREFSDRGEDASRAEDSALAQGAHAVGDVRRGGPCDLVAHDPPRRF